MSTFSINIKWILKILAGVLFLAAFAQITIDLPFNEAEVSITGQSFAVLIMAIFYGQQDALLVVILYLLLGGLGLPIFADGSAGWEKFPGGTGGFLIGFLIAAGLVGYLGDKGWGRHFGKSISAMTIGTIIIVSLGVAWLTKVYNFEKALEWGFYPVLAGAGIKIIVGGIIPPLYYRYFSNQT